MPAVNDYRTTTAPHPTDAPDESLRKVVSLMSGTSVSVVEAQLIEFEKTVALTTVPEPLSLVDLFVDEVSIRALETNVAPVKYGFSADNDSQLWMLLPTEWRSFKAPQGKKINLKRIYIDAGANAEGVVVHAIA